MQPLNSARLKVRRANIHINALKKSIRRSFEPQHTIREKVISRGPLEGLGIIDLGIDPSAKVERWGLIIGDIVTNLRSSLDHIAWELAMLHSNSIGKKLTQNEERTIKFPLCDDTKNKDNSKSIVGALKFVLPAAHREIKRFQPYNSKNWPALNLLKDLNLLANTDKHRLVTPSQVHANIRLTKDDPGIIAYLNNGSNYKFLNPGDMQLEPNITYEIVVYPRDVLHALNIDVLPLMHDFIRDEVIPSFSRFFE